MDKYTLMRLSETLDDDAYEAEDFPLEDKEPKTAQEFKEKYKQFYSDIKTDLKEDW